MVVAAQVIDYENLLRGQMQEIINLMRLEGAEVNLAPVRVRHGGCTDDGAGRKTATLMDW